MRQVTAEIELTPIEVLNEEAVTRYVVNCGGTRSSKTFSILQCLYFKASQDSSGRLYSVVSETMPHLKRGAERDFFSFLSRYDMYCPENHNKTDHIYKVGRSLIEFFSADSMDKVHGPGRDVLFYNEIQNSDYETFFHLVQRTRDQVYVDYNPTHEFWIYPKLLNNPTYKKDITFIHSTIMDNPFITDAIKKDVLRRAEIDENYRKVYLEGVPGVLEGLVFRFVQSSLPQEARFLCYGLDFGYSVDPTSLVAIYIQGNNLYFDERIYQTGLTNADIGGLMSELGVKKGFDEIYADSSEPKSITDLQRQGFNVRAVRKGSDSIRAGIDIMRQYNLHLTKNSINGIKEFRGYHWVIKEGRPAEPSKVMNHFVDACRYGVMMKLGNFTYSDLLLT
jgi:phage terminase large subunit